MTATTTRQRVPFVDLQVQHAEMGDELHAALARTLASGGFVLGAEVEAFESEFAQYCGTQHGVGVSSGTAALELILRALGLGPGDEVVTAANSFVASAFAISYTGATPVFVDVDPVTRNMLPEALAAAITPRTRAVVPVHLYGQPADMGSINRIAGQHGLAVVEDACQAHGARYCGQRVGSLGTAAAFSFYPAKNLGALGDGGIVVTSDPALADKVRSLRNYGAAQKYVSTEVGWNHRLDGLQAAVLRLKLRRLDDWNQARGAAADVYRSALAGMPEVTLPGVADDAEHVWHLFTANVADRDRVRARLTTQGVDSGIHYPIPIPHQEAYAHLGHALGAFPVTEWDAATTLSLPMHPSLSPATAQHVAALLTDAVSSRPCA